MTAVVHCQLLLNWHGAELRLMRACIDGRVAPRSGLASKHFIDTGAGVIDADYRGEVKVLLFNHSDVDFPGMSSCRSARGCRA